MPSDRRMFLSAGLGVTAALASGLTTSAQAVSSESPPFPVNVSLDPDVRAAAAHDFGRLIHRQPRGVLKPASSADIDEPDALGQGPGRQGGGARAGPFDLWPRAGRTMAS